MREYAQTSARFCSVTIPNVTRPCPTCEFMTRPSQNTEMWGTNGSIGPVFLVEQDKLRPNKGQCRTGYNFFRKQDCPAQSGTVGHCRGCGFGWQVALLLLYRGVDNFLELGGLTHKLLIIHEHLYIFSADTVMAMATSLILHWVII